MKYNQLKQKKDYLDSKRAITNLEQKTELFFRNFDIKEIDQDTIAIITKKHLLLGVEGNLIQITKGENVQIANHIHLNPKIDSNNIKPSEISYYSLTKDNNGDI